MVKTKSSNLVIYLPNLCFQDPDDRLEDDKLIIERILILIRNILDIPASPEDEKCTDDDASIHDQVNIQNAHPETLSFL